MSTTAIIGLDVGGTKVAGGLLTSDDELIAVTQRPTLVDGQRDPGSVVTLRVAAALVDVASRAGLTVDGIGAGFPEYVNPQGQLSSHEVLHWTTQPGELLAELAPTTVDSDVRCAATGEGALGVARDLASFAYVIVGTGLSYALVENGRARPGVRGEAIAIGQLEVSRSVDPSTTLSLERYASGDAIRERFEAASGDSATGAADIFALAANGHSTALEIIDTAAQAVAAGAASLARILDPGAIVFGGGVSASGKRWRELVESAYLERSQSRPAAPPLRWATLGSEAGIIGAAIAHRMRIRQAQGSST